MNTTALPLRKNPFQFLPRSQLRNHPFLQALKSSQYGSIMVTSEHGEKYNYAGPYPGPKAHLKLYDDHALDDLVARGEIGFAEAYVDRRWGSDNLAELLTFALINAPSLEKFFHGRPWHVLISKTYAFFQKNSQHGSRRNIMSHYDLGNEFYALWLDKSMTYSCGLFEGNKSRSLEEAQLAKYHRALIQLNAKPGDHILEIGCGWGGFAEAAAKQGVRVTGITLSPEQAVYAAERLHKTRLDSLAQIELIDYRNISGQFDHIVSIGMFEHVGERYWDTYFDIIRKRLLPDGKALVQTITLDDALFETLHGHTGFIEQVIFPGGMLPSKSRFREAAQQAGLICEETYAFGKDYARTAEEWLGRFNAHKNEVHALGYDEAFIRLWNFYLSACIAAFTSGRTDVMQARLSRPMA